MLRKLVSRVSEIFVGRIPELERLEDLWDLACQDREHFVYVFLNAPGIGKTTLINYFGEYLESERKGLFIKFVCNSEYDSQVRINKSMIKLIEQVIQRKKEIINNYIDFNIESEERKGVKKKFERVKLFIEDILTQPYPSLNDIFEVFIDISNIIPIFFATDEIQEFQKPVFKGSKNGVQEEETALHYLTRILKGLMNSRILLVLSGTRYHILSQIGGKIGSPIHEKIKPIIIRNFTQEEVISYVERIRTLIKEANIEQGVGNISKLVKNYQQFLFAFSGGHPRTIERITSLFLEQLPFLIAEPKYLIYNTFMNFLLPLTKKTLNTTLFSKEKENKIVELSVKKQFSIIKDWVLNKGCNGHFLGQAPEIADDAPANEEINDIIYELMNIGVIVQNGSFNYHLTSYFYFLVFLQPFTEPHDAFLRQVLNNKYFNLMCGRHSGFGYTFENIFLSALIIYGTKNEENVNIPLKASNIRNLEVIKGKIK